MNMYRIAGFEVHVLRLRLYTAMYVNTHIFMILFHICNVIYVHVCYLLHDMIIFQQ